MKKNQFALIFLTLIVMLAVWYVKSPLAQKDDEPMQGDTSIVTSSRLDAIKNMRDKGRTGSENLVSAIGNKVAMSVGTQQEIDELDDLEGLNEGLRNKASGNDQTSQDKMKLHDKKQKLREKINHRKDFCNYL